MIIFTFAFQISKYTMSSSTIEIIYMLLLPLIQCIIATSFEIVLLAIIIECFLSTIQFHYIYGAIAVGLYNILYIILFDVAIQNEAGIDGSPANTQNVTWIIVSVICHILFKYIQNYIHVKWFTFNKISVSKYSLTNSRAELINLSFNEESNANEY